MYIVVVRLFRSVMIASVLVSIAAFAEQLSQPERKAIIARSFSGQPLPKWQNGFLVTHDLPEPTVHVYDRSGSEIVRTTLALSGSVRTLLSDISITPSRKIAVAGTVDSAEGASAAFIAWLGPDGRVDRVVRTSPFAAFKICFSNDGNLWAVGREHLLDYNEKPEYDVIRIYDGNGQLIRTVLPRTSFAVRHPHPGSTAFVVASADRMGVYSVHAKEWIELSLSGAILGRWKGIEAKRVAGAALTDAGSVYVSGFYPGKPEGRTVFSKLDRGTGSWLPIDTPFTNDPFTAIYGTDQDQIVVASKLPEFLWVKSEKATEKR
jgi:hypothetical protein